MAVSIYQGENHGVYWQPVDCKSEGRTREMVYSLKVQPTEGGRRLYIAENIVVHNSIYGFTGATPEAMNVIKDQFDATEPDREDSEPSPVSTEN